MDEVKSYYYTSENGEPVGPVSFEELVSLIKGDELKNSTFIWNGEGEWTPIKDTEFNEYIILNDKPYPPPPKMPPQTPPPPPPIARNSSNVGTPQNISHNVNNKMAWGIVASTFFYIIGYIVGVVLAFLDYKKIKEKGLEVPAKWTVLVPIIYLWKRSNLFENTKKLFWIGCLGVLISFGIFMEEFESSYSSSVMEAEACYQVTQMVQLGPYLLGMDGYGVEDLECENVRVDYQMENGNYAATATLDNGHELGITIKSDGVNVKAYID